MMEGCQHVFKSNIKDEYLLVAAIDFGTTYSGYALSFRDDPMKIQFNQRWIAGSQNLISLKTPTCVLLNPDGKFEAFGFEAENKYVSLAGDDEHHGWRLFRNFKMILHNNKSLCRTSKVEDIKGQPMEALPLTVMSLKYIKEHLLNHINTQKVGIDINDIRFVITVPAIWDDNSKQFMREAAILAGIDTNQLILALEPEVASVWCTAVNSDERGVLSKVGTKYMVIDLGGGTADISVHEILSERNLKELHRAVGGPHGGIYVDSKFFKLISDIFGQEALIKLKEQEMFDYLELFREWESKKTTVSPDEDGYVMFRVPCMLKQFSESTNGRTLNEQISLLGYDNGIAMRGGDKLKISTNLLRSLFYGPVDNLVRHVKELFREMDDVKAILLVGGFAESQIVQRKLTAEFDTKRLFVPEQPGLAVLKGAVLFGHNPALISGRVVRYTYCVGVRRPFDMRIHDKTKIVRQNGIDWILGLEIFVRRDTELPFNHTLTKFGFRFPGKSNGRVAIYRSTEHEPMYSSDPTCERQGEIKVPLLEEESHTDKPFDLTFIFGATELMVKACVQNTNKEARVMIDCL